MQPGLNGVDPVTSSHFSVDMSEICTTVKLYIVPFASFDNLGAIAPYLKPKSKLNWPSFPLQTSLTVNIRGVKIKYHHDISHETIYVEISHSS